MKANKTINFSDILTEKTIILDNKIENFVDYLLDNSQYSRSVLIKFFKKKSQSQRKTVFNNINREYLKQEYGKICYDCDYGLMMIKNLQPNILKKAVMPGKKLVPCEFISTPKGEPVKMKYAWQQYFEDISKLKADEWVECPTEQATTVLEWLGHIHKKGKRRRTEIESLYSILFRKNKKYLQKNLFYQIRSSAKKENSKKWYIGNGIKELNDHRVKLLDHNEFQTESHKDGIRTFSELKQAAIDNQRKPKATPPIN